ncbi:hypothetical protein [Lactococcus lactis]|uniref:hypothetical protein n=1 Tax=Lactococcus lactis TaxID=1358 RepID=UPI001F0FD8EE|nr:hypothetical protein [Lactococcus lactis]UMU17988.1 hypothetical protein FO444_04695 [Lactococcus lactis subsp. lactis]UMU18140.1 hypothetical protein FO444_05540 [Lactococcus lactis subsp. lactis]
MSEKKYYVKSLISCEPYTSDADKGWLTSASNDSATWIYKKYRTAFTKSELARIMGGVLYRTFAHQFDPQLAEELYKLGYRTTQTIEEWIEARYEFDNIWEWINPLIELVPVEDGE